jgi:peptidoglycan/LPS O-acetylase OafA/YrhL
MLNSERRPNRSKSQRNPQLDLLRGIAVLMVVLYHYRYFEAFRIGWAGVDLFFVLSGFLISGLLFNDWKHNGQISLSHFFVRRGFKIYPAFYFFLFTTWVAMANLDGLLRRFTAEIFFLQDYLPHLWTPTWSLAVEEQFYILLPLLLVLIARFHNPERPFAAIPFISLSLLVICLALRVVRHPVLIDDARYAFHFRADSLFAGVALGYLFHFHSAAFHAMSRWWLLPVGLFALLPLWFYGESVQLSPYVLTCNTVAFVCLLWWIFPRSNIRAPWIEQVGVYSYSIYLWHGIIALLFREMRPRFIWLMAYVATSIAAGSIWEPSSSSGCWRCPRGCSL